MSVATVLLNNALVAYGDKAVAAMGIVTKAYMFIAFVHMGIANGIQPLLGYCYGANNRDRFWGILKFSGVLTVICGTVLSAVYIVCSEPVVGLFIDDPEVVAYGGPMLIATSLAGPILGLLFLAINSMQALGRPVPATVLSVCRQGLFFIPLLYILDAVFGLNGINFTQTVADYLSIVISLLLLRSTCAVPCRATGQRCRKTHASRRHKTKPPEPTGSDGFCACIQLQGQRMGFPPPRPQAHAAAVHRSCPYGRPASPRGAGSGVRAGMQSADRTARPDCGRNPPGSRIPWRARHAPARGCTGSPHQGAVPSSCPSPKSSVKV